MSERRLRIMILITSLEQAGAEQVVYDSVVGLKAAGFEVAVVTMYRRGPYFERLLAQGYNVRTLDIGGKFAPRAFLSLVRSMARFAPDIVDAHLFHADVPGRIAAWLVRRKRQPLFVSHQQLADGGARWHRLLLERLTARGVDRFACVSHSVARAAHQQLGLASRRLVVLPNGRELSSFLALQPIDPTRQPPCWSIGVVGRLRPQKDHALLLEALALLPATLVVQAWVAGEGPLLESLQARAAQLGVTKRVHWLGRREDIPTLLATTDLFVMCSAYEGLPVAAVEAMAAARPIVATDVPGLRDCLTSQCALLVPYRDPAQLASAITQLLLDRTLAARLAIHARQRALAEFSRERMLVDLIALYNELLHSRYPQQRMRNTDTGHRG
jgi:glycosyltransferase involved in cell wall biosynthesis